MNNTAKKAVKVSVFALGVCALAVAVAVADAVFQKVADLFAGGSDFMAAAWFPAAKHLTFLALCCAGFAVISRGKQIKEPAKGLLIGAPASAAYIAAGTLLKARPALGYAACAAVLAGFLLFFFIKKKPWMHYVSVSLSCALLLLLSLAGSAYAGKVRTMQLNFHYSTGAGSLLKPVDFKKRTGWMKEAGVGTVWLAAYFFGRFDSDIETLVRMKTALEERGFEVNAISVPVGHPGNSLDPVNRPDMDCRIPSTWRYRVDAKGKPVHYCACVNEAMLKDNMAAAAQLKQAGFKKVFYDDDLRMGNFGPQVQGCFCKECIARFNDSFGYSLTRAELAKAVLAPQRGEVCENWIDYNCGKITGFMRASAAAGPKPGIMVMHHGDRRHGIDIPAIKQAAPGCLFRVGEGNFNSREFTAFEGKVSLMKSVAKHMALVGDVKRCYSESTVFPAEALAPEEWVDKILLEIRLGLRNIFLMSGSWFLTEHYWSELRGRLREFREIAAFIDEHPEESGLNIGFPGS